MKFRLGDRVTYTSRNPKYDFNGTIVGYEKSWSQNNVWYIIVPDEPQVSKGNMSFHRVWAQAGPRRLNEFFGENRTKMDACMISGKSKNLMPGMYDYSPSQEGDRDGDL